MEMTSSWRNLRMFSLRFLPRSSFRSQKKKKITTPSPQQLSLQLSAQHQDGKQKKKKFQFLPIENNTWFVLYAPFVQCAIPLYYVGVSSSWIEVNRKWSINEVSDFRARVTHLKEKLREEILFSGKLSFCICSLSLIFFFLFFFYFSFVNRSALLLGAVARYPHRWLLILA